MLAQSPQQMSMRELFFAAIDSCVAFLEFSADGKIIDANQTYLALSGYALEELVGKHHRTICSAEDVLSPGYALFWKKLHTGVPFSDLFRHQRKNGTVYWLETTYVPVLSSNGEIERIITIGMDITKRQQETQKKLAQFDVFDHIALIAELRHNGEIVSINEVFANLLGYAPEDIAGKNFGMLFSAQSMVDKKNIWTVVRSGHPFTGTLPFLAKDGTEKLYESAFVPNFDDSGRVKCVVMIAVESSHSTSIISGRIEELRHMATATEHTDAAIMLTDASHRILYVNNSFANTYGYDLKELSGKNPQIIYGISAQKIEKQKQRAQQQQLSICVEELTYAKNGRGFWTAMYMTPVTDADGTLRYIVAVHIDMTEAKMHEVLLHKVLSALALDVPIPKVLSILCREVEHLAPGTALAVFGANEASRVHPIAYPSLPNEFSRLFTAYSGLCKPTAARAVETKSMATEPDIENDINAPETRDVLLAFDIRSCWSVPVKDSYGKTIGAITFYYRDKRDPDPFHLRIVNVLQHLCSLALERARTTDAMRKISYYDDLTGLPNRTLLCTRVERLITKAMRLKKPLAVFRIGLDRFKRFNDSLGYEASNLFLRTIGERLSEKYGEPAIVSRVISDEFVLVCYDCDARQAALASDKIQEMVRTPSMAEGIIITTTASIGISLFPENGITAEELLHNAELAMHQAKTAGRAQYSFFSKEENHRAKAKLSLEAHLRDAVKKRQLHLCYQPKIWLANGKLYGVEALARWNSEEYGPVSPSQFIPLAEEIGIIEELGRWTLVEACRQMNEWQTKGIAVPSVAVNLSPSNFRDETLPGFIHNCLEKENLTPANLLLELTENVLLDNDSETLRTITRAHEMGVHLSMDDFGTGYSSLSYLRQLPFAELKLDKSFVRGIDRDKTSQDLGKAVMHIAESLSLIVVAEGVESQQEYTLLKNLGYHVIQGYFSGSPLSPEEFELWHAKRS